MLFVLGEHGIRSVEDLADCATDDLDGWNEFKDGKAIRHAGILDRYRVSRQDCEALIIERSHQGWMVQKKSLYLAALSASHSFYSFYKNEGISV